MSKMPWILFFILGSVMAKKNELGEEPDYYPKINPNPRNIEELTVQDIPMYFDTFNRFYEIEYKNDEHLNRSYEKFTDNVKRIIIINKFSTAAKFAINEFSHLTLEEFTNQYTGFNDTGMNSSDASNFVYNSTEGAPTNLDWRTLGISAAVRHQGPCKSSYVFSAIGNIESQMAKNFKMSMRLSEQQAYDCESTGSCKVGGLPHKVMESIMAIGGIEEQVTYIYDPKDQRECKIKEDQMIVKVKSVQRFMPVYENSLIALLAMYGPIVTTMYVSESVKNYHKGVLWPTDCDKKPNHAVLLIGYGITADSVPFWIIKNSWGMMWGENGYIRLIRGEHACNIGQYVATATVEPMFQKRQVPAVRSQDEPPLTGFLNNVAGAIYGLITTLATEQTAADTTTTEMIQHIALKSTPPTRFYDEVKSMESNIEDTTPSIKKNTPKVKKYIKGKEDIFRENSNKTSKQYDDVAEDSDERPIIRIIKPKRPSSSSDSSSASEERTESHKDIKIYKTSKRDKVLDEDKSDLKSYDSDDAANTDSILRVTRV